MRMGNYLGARPESTVVMSATESDFGVQHPTVVPTNFEPTAEAVDEVSTDDGRGDDSTVNSE